MSNTTATSVLKDALKVAEAERDKVHKDTKQIIDNGKIAQSRLDEAQGKVDDLIEAIDRLDRPEEKARAVEKPDPYLLQRDEFPVTQAQVTPPDGEQRTIAGVSITRRRAE